MKLSIEKINEVYLRVFADDSIEYDLSQFFTFEVPGARFTPAFRARLWDGKIRLYDLLRKTLYVGLLDYVIKFADRHDLEIEYKNDVLIYEKVSHEQVSTYMQELNFPTKIEVRDYQIDAIQRALYSKRAILLSPTGSGKSLIIYTICSSLIF